MSNLTNNFTADANRTLSNAQRIAYKYKLPAIGSDQLLLGLLQIRGSQAEQLLQEQRVKPDAMKSRLEASMKLAAKTTEPTISGLSTRNRPLTPEAEQVLGAARAEAAEQGVTYIDPRAILLGMLRTPSSEGGMMLQQYGLNLDDMRSAAQLAEVPPTKAKPPKVERSLQKSRFPVTLSPIFIGLVAITAISGYLAYNDLGNSSRTIFLFVTGGWLISLALHEFGHALVGFWGGDHTVVDKGYLTLNPLKYTHPLLSIGLPMLFLILGGIGLPGGAVYINRLMIRKRFMHSLVSAAGPIATLSFAILLLIPFFLGLHHDPTRTDFWAGMAFLVLLQFIALAINLIPLPGLDGFGIIEPFLPDSVVQGANSIRQWSFILLYFFLVSGNPATRAFWDMIYAPLLWIDRNIVFLSQLGFDLYRFWA